MRVGELVAHPEGGSFVAYSVYSLKPFGKVKVRWPAGGAPATSRCRP